MKIHREGYGTLVRSAGIFILLLLFIHWSAGLIWLTIVSAALLIVLWLFLFRFFRVPVRILPEPGSYILAPADGKIIDISKVTGLEIGCDEAYRVSIFMSVNNVHANWIPVGGTVRKSRYSPGRHLLAMRPKSSMVNERSTLVIEDDHGRMVLVRQIAGLLARRVVTYPKAGQRFEMGDELGFIKFGSRVDLLIPTDARLLVRLGDITIGRETILADW